MRRQVLRSLPLLLLTVFFKLVECTPSVLAETTDQDVLDIQRVRSLLSSRCFLCHGPDAAHREGGFRLDQQDSYLSPADSGLAPVIPGDARRSPVWLRISTDQDSERMPPAEHSPPLTTEEQELLAAWIANGAHLPQHWSFVPPAGNPPPSITQISKMGQGLSEELIQAWSHPIDLFVLSEQVKRKMVPSPEATRPELLRRVSLDLIGLPPSPDQVVAFESDLLPGAYERQVDRLLADPAFGEHWARKWLDLARYADSAGYADDPDRTIWAYRDWVVKALNDNMPVDHFTIQQIAGDLLPEPTNDQLVATAFHRNTLTNNEGGTNDEEFRNVAVVDRVNTTLSVWMGVTIGCAQCHTHKYDPFTHEEYFRLFAIFNQSQDADRRDESPYLELFSEAQVQQFQRWRAELLQADLVLHQLAGVAAELSGWNSSAEPANWQPKNGIEFDVDESRDTRSRAISFVAGKIFLVPPFYFRQVDQTLLTARSQRQSLLKRITQPKPETTVPIIRELARENRRATRIHLRGDYRSLGDPVIAGTPTVFPPIIVDGQTASLDEGPNRLDLARWLVDDRNPLTARVWMNRLWESLFGIGLVRTSEEFGAQGDPPSHPQLLDWLATELIAQEWDMKKMLRILVTSQTYRQSSRQASGDLDVDPENTWLARGPRVRLTAEMVRDSSLFSAGLLSRSMYGPPVLPPQPNSGLRAAFGSATDWTTSEGEDRYRRGLYTKWRRSNPYPSMATFDAPSREVCMLRRDSTNTPLQALVTLNDPAFVEAAQALARRVMMEPAATLTLEQRMQWAFQLCTARVPQPAEMQVLLELLDAARQHFQRDHSHAVQLATDPLGPLPADIEVVDLAAWTSVCNVLLNLDEVLMKR